MENTKIFIDIDDEITFVAERVLATKTPYVILVIPERATILSSLASLKLLSYVVGKSGKQVVVVTMDEVGKVLAERAGFLTRNRVGEVETTIWDSIEGAKDEQKIEEVVPEAKKSEVVTEQEAIPVVDKEEDIVEPEILKEEEQNQPSIIAVQPIIQEKEIERPVEVLPKEEIIEEKPLEEPEQSVLDIEEIPLVETKEVPAVEPKITNSKPKYVESVKIVKLDGFELIVGGDAAVIRKSREIERKVITKKADTISSLRLSSERYYEEGIVGKDIEANIAKKKITNKSILQIMQTVDTIKKNTSGRFKKWMVIPIAILLLLLIIFSFVIMPSAQVAITVKAQPLTDSSDVLANVNTSQVDPNAKTIPAYYIDVNESSSSSANTTGAKVIGNKATGNVTFYSVSKTSFTIPKGTVFVTNDQNALSYTLDNDVAINGTPAAVVTQTGGLTASDIGTKYNIAANTPFTIQLSNVPAGITAASGSAFTGGTSQNAQVVAQTDQDHLLAGLEQQLYQKGQDELQAKLTSDMIVAKDTQKNEDVTKSFDSNVGDKSNILNLSLTTKTSVIVYKLSDLTTYENKVIAQSLNKNDTISNLSVSQTYKGYDTTAQNLKIKIDAKALATPVLDKATITKNITRTLQGNAASYIKKVNGVVDVSIKVSPFWYDIFKMMPLRQNNITIVVKTQ